MAAGQTTRRMNTSALQLIHWPYNKSTYTNPPFSFYSRPVHKQIRRRASITYPLRSLLAYSGLVYLPLAISGPIGRQLRTMPQRASHGCTNNQVVSVCRT